LLPDKLLRLVASRAQKSAVGRGLAIIHFPFAVVSPILLAMKDIDDSITFARRDSGTLPYFNTPPALLPLPRDMLYSIVHPAVTTSTRFLFGNLFEWMQGLSSV
jgi:hypothetical protein